MTGSMKLTWSDLGEHLSTDDKIAVFEGYCLAGGLVETNTTDSVDYFMSLRDMSSSPEINKEYIVVPLILVNDKLMELDKPETAVLVGINEEELLFKYGDRIKKFPDRKLSLISTSSTFIFENSDQYDHFRTAILLKFNKSLPDMNKKNKQRLQEGIDSVTLDIPLLIRLLEYAREDAKTDMDLHLVAEKLIVLSQENGVLSMEDYDTIVNKVSEAFGLDKATVAERLYSHHKSIAEGCMCGVKKHERKRNAKKEIQITNEDIEQYTEELDSAGYGITEETRRLDKKCWKGKKIGNPKTKMKGGIRVNNCVPVEENEDFPELRPNQNAPQTKPHPLATGIAALRTINNLRNMNSDTVKNAVAGEISNFARSSDDASSKNVSTLRNPPKRNVEF